MIIIKIGGGNAVNLEGIANDLSSLHELFIIVHGANALRDSLARQLQKPRRTVTSVSGYSSVFSDADTIDLQMMAYAGLRNKRIVELLQQKGINALGMCGLDGGVIRGKRNSGIRVRENGKLKLLRDLSGKPKEVNKKLLNLLLESGIVPVLTVPIMDEKGTAVNSENDDITAVLQAAYREEAERVIHLVEAPGFLQDPEDPSSLISSLSAQQLTQWEAKMQGRFKRKLLAVKRLFENGVKEVIISDGRVEQPVTDALAGKGTVIK
jgi:acetylglutamate/LysW-gamma-L-alpha-aminoadipate kinase